MSKTTNNPAWKTAPFEMFMMVHDDERAKRIIARYRKTHKVRVRREDGWIFATIKARGKKRIDHERQRPSD